MRVKLLPVLGDQNNVREFAIHAQAIRDEAHPIQVLLRRRERDYGTCGAVDLLRTHGDEQRLEWQQVLANFTPFTRVVKIEEQLARRMPLPFLRGRVINVQPQLLLIACTEERTSL
jgi:hypothetical protein